MLFSSKLIELERNRSTSHQQNLAPGAFRCYREATLTFTARWRSCPLGLTVTTLNCPSHLSSYHPAKFSSSTLNSAKHETISNTTAIISLMGYQYLEKSTWHFVAAVQAHNNIRARISSSLRHQRSRFYCWCLKLSNLGKPLQRSGKCQGIKVWNCRSCNILAVFMESEYIDQLLSSY